MEKPVKMSLETAREFYKDATEITKKWLLENFTKEELEGKKGFTWEDSFSGKGYYIRGMSQIDSVSNLSKTNENKNVFLTEAHAKSALAFAQLSYIVAKYNEGKEKCVVHFNIHKGCGYLQVASWETIEFNLSFNRKEDAETSLKVNQELWEQYHMIEK